MKKILLFLLSCWWFSSAYCQTFSIGKDHTLIVCNDGTVKSLGRNFCGALGDGTLIDRTSPVQVNNIDQIVAVSASELFSLALRRDGTVWAWGENNVGQLGDSSTTNRLSPVQVHNLSGIIAIESGFEHSIALKNDGTVWAWGLNYDGQLGDGTTTNRHEPVQVANLNGVTKISAGWNHCLAVRSDGTVWAWGGNDYGQLGTTGSPTNIPHQTYSITNAVDVSAGMYFSLFLRNDGVVFSCGWGAYGHLGDSTGNTYPFPIQIYTMSGIIDIAAGEDHSLALAADGTIWGWGWNVSGEVGDGTDTMRYYPVKIIKLTGMISLGLMDGHSSIALRNDGTIWTWGDNGYGILGDESGLQRDTAVQFHLPCEVPLPGQQPSHFISGYLYDDSTNDCSIQAGEMKFPFKALIANPGNHFTCTNDSGDYLLGLNDSINYSITPIVPERQSQMITNPCPPDYSVYLNSGAPHDSSGFDFGFDVTPCWQLRVDVVGNRKRRCLRNTTIIYYWNEGVIDATNASVYIKLDQYDIPVSASMPYSTDADGNLVFSLGTIQPNQFGIITLTDSISCLFNIVGLTQCTKAWILPANQCLIDSTTGAGWDHSSTGVTGECVNDTCRFVIRNNGSGNMNSPQSYRVYADNILVYTGSYQLVSADSLVVLWVSGGSTIRLEADQHPDHPGHSHPRATLEGCGTDGSGGISTGQVNQAPMDDEDVDVEIDCMQIRDSYDPNEKDNAPEGVDWAHYILPNTPIDFIVHFQNTGTDTAFRVVVIDSLSNDLDLATLELGASSHPYSVSLSGQGVAVLKFTFSNINLSDSTTDELNSHGFVKYKISPKSTVPLGTRINNSADIYFDYNFPVRTNTAYVTLGNELVLGVTQSALAHSGSVVAYPNPTKGFITVESGKNHSIQQLTLYNADGRILKSIVNCPLSTVNLNLQGLSAGIYYLDCRTERGSEKVKVVKY